MDLIERKSLLDHIERCGQESKGLIGATCTAIKCYVEQMPTVQEMARIEKAVQRRKSYMYACSKCKGTFYFCGTDCNYNFCPRCGRMFEVGGEDGK